MKSLMYIGAIIGGTAGAYLPALFGDSNIFSFWSIVGSLVGGLFGIWAGYKIQDYFEI
ncbi:hypothetical protein KDA00_01750 [Candidatus Saccharibacteria bacterium]|nr:hypothetical protein [Candidatus Saccharibacteria bacterium]